MKVSIILAHPSNGSFNHAIAETVSETLKESGHAVTFHDLYQEKFPPLLPAEEISRKASLPPIIRMHCAEVSTAEGIVIVHPNWWGQPPAVLKGWLDRILRPGIAYNFTEKDRGEGVPEGLLKARAAIVFTTSNTPFEREQAVFGDPLETIWRKCIFELCGVGNFYRKNFGIIVTSSPGQRKKWLEETAEITKQYFPPISS